MSISSEVIGAVDVETQASFRNIGTGSVSILAAVLRRIAQWHRGRADMALLQQMTDRDLRDIGLNRTDVQAIGQGLHRVIDHPSRLRHVY
jgi:uncharacterized protein YjiS (DUF1127 family)